MAIALLVCLIAAALGLFVWQQRAKRFAHEAKLAESRRSSAAQADYVPTPSKEECLALARLASEIEGEMIYTSRGRVKKVTIGDWTEVDLGKGNYVRWGTTGRTNRGSLRRHGIRHERRWI